MTTRGRSLLALAVSMLFFGRLGGMRELIMTGSAFLLVLIVGFVLVWIRRGGISVRRTVSPSRTIVGRSVRVELVVEATGRFGVGPLLLADRVPRSLGPTPRLALPGGTAKRSRAVAYTFTPRLRGRYGLGPVEITHTDPFGAVRRRTDARGSSSLLVYPAFEDVSVLPSGVQRLGIVRHSPLVGHGDEFYALRQYQDGDDLRKVHWPTSMRLGKLVVRQEELLAEPRALVVLDTAASKHRGTGVGASIEAAVSACASIAVLAVRRRMRIDIVTPDGLLLQQRRPNEEQLLEALALVQPSRRTGISHALDRSDRPLAGRPALVVVISPGLSRAEIAAVALRVRRTSGGAIVWIDAQSYAPATDEISKRRRPGFAGLPATALPIVRLAAGDSFRKQWQTVIKDVALAR